MVGWGVLLNSKTWFIDRAELDFRSLLLYLLPLSSIRTSFTGLATLVPGISVNKTNLFFTVVYEGLYIKS